MNSPGGDAFSSCGRPLFSFLALAVLLLAACQDAADPGGLGHTRDPLEADVVRVATATSEATAVPTPSATALSQTTLDPATSLPDATPRATPGATARPKCVHEYFFEPAPDECPSESSQTSAAAEQPFERGFMVWLEGMDAILVFGWDGSWQQFEDTFEEGEPENDPALVPPDQKFQPVRGFGKVWRDNPQVREQLGWGLSRELGFETTYQLKQSMNAEDTILFLRAFNGQVLALTYRTPDGGDWVVAAS